MALVHVRPKHGKGGDSYVSQSWIDRWPDDWEVVPEDLAPVGVETKSADAVTTAPTGNKKEK